MTELPRLTARDVRDTATPQSFQRGQDYYRSGAVLDPVRQGRRLKARVEGSQYTPYHVAVTLDEQGVAAATCSCPYDWGGYCKHIVALLLTWVHDPDEFHEVEEVDAVLERKSKSELIALIHEMLARAPDLERLLEAPLPSDGQRRTPVDSEVYRRQVRYAFRDAEDWQAVYAIATELQSIVNIANGFADQGDWANAAVIYQAVVEESLEGYEMTHDEGDIAGVIGEAVAGLGECLAQRTDEPAARRVLLRWLFDVYRRDIQMGGLGLTDEVPGILLDHATPDDLSLLENWVHQALSSKGDLRSPGDDFSSSWRRQSLGRFLLDIQEARGDVEAYLRGCREAGLYLNLALKLLELDRLDEALTVVRSDLAQTHEVLAFANALVSREHAAQGESLVQERLAAGFDDGLAAWLAHRYASQGDLAAALNLHLQRFQARPSLQVYQTIRSLAQDLDRWADLRPRLWAGLETNRQHQVLLGIFLDEGEIDRALGIVQHVPYMQLHVAQAAEATHPREAIGIYMDAARAAIGYRTRKSYQTAAQHLVRVKRLYEALSEAATWQRVITELRQQHRNLPALQDELNKAGL